MKGNWTGVGWFRLHFALDSTLQDQTLALTVAHFGASEIYLDGKLIQHFKAVGVANDPRKKFRAFDGITGLHLDGKAAHTLAVRYTPVAPTT